MIGEEKGRDAKIEVCGSEHCPVTYVEQDFPVDTCDEQCFRAPRACDRWGRMDLVDTKVEVQYSTEVSAWKGFPERITQRSFERKR